MQNSVLMFTFFDFTQEIHFLSKFDSKKQNCQFKLEILVPILIGICRTKWWCFLFPFSTGKTLFWENLVPQIQNWKFKLKPGTLSNSNKQNWMVVLTLSVIDPKHSFYANLVKETKIVSLTWNLVLMLIRISRTHWWCSLFMLSTANTFFGDLGPKNQNCHFILKFGTWAYSNKQNSMDMFNSSALYQNYPFWANFVQKIKVFRLS